MAPAKHMMRREERRIHSLPARQLLTPVSPILGWGLVDQTSILLGGSDLPQSREIGPRVGFGCVGKDLIQPVGGEPAQWITNTCSFSENFSPFSSFSLLPSLIVKACFSLPLDQNGPWPPYIYFPVVFLFCGFMWERYVI